MSSGIKPRTAWVASCFWVLIMAVVGFLGTQLRTWVWANPINNEAMLLTFICVIGICIMFGITDWS